MDEREDILPNLLIENVYLNEDEERFNLQTSLLNSPYKNKERLDNRKNWVSYLISFCRPILV